MLLLKRHALSLLSTTLAETQRKSSASRPLACWGRLSLIHLYKFNQTVRACVPCPLLLLRYLIILSVRSTIVTPLVPHYALHVLTLQLDPENRPTFDKVYQTCSELIDTYSNWDLNDNRKSMEKLNISGTVDLSATLTLEETKPEPKPVTNWNCKDWDAEPR